MRLLRRVVKTVVGGALVALGVALLVLPGPGLLVVLAGLVVLASEFPSLHRFLEPVRRKAYEAADASVANSTRLALSTAFGLALVAVGVVWAWNPGVPFGGIGVGLGLVVSGLAVLVLLVISLRRVRA